MSLETTTASRELDEWRAELAAAGLDAPWTQPGPLIRPKASAMQAAVWRWQAIEPLLRRTPEFMKPGRGAERRILRLQNPGVPERTSGPSLSNEYTSGIAPALLTRPNVGRSPVTPLNAAGHTIEPHVSEPILKGTRPAPTAAPEPLEEPPAQ